MGYEFYFSDYEKKRVIKLPILPEQLPTQSFTADVEDFRTADGRSYAIIGGCSLMETGLDIEAPDTGKKLSFLASDTRGPAIDKLCKDAMDDKKPIRLMVIKPNGKYYINRPCAITSYSAYIDRLNKWKFSISLKRWREIE